MLEDGNCIDVLNGESQYLTPAVREAGGNKIICNAEVQKESGNEDNTHGKPSV